MIKDVTKKDKMRSKNIRKKLVVDSFREIGRLEIIGRGILRWKRMNEESYVKKCLEWRPEVGRTGGRPKRWWIEGIVEGVEKRKAVLELNEKVLAWKSFVSNGCPII